MGLMPDEFYGMTLYEYRCIIARHAFTEANKWKHTRLIAYTIVKANGGAKDVAVDDFLPLLTDPIPKKLKAPTPEETEQTRQRAQDAINRFANQIKK